MVSIAVGNLPFPERDLAEEPHNVSLGRFMTAWSQVEVLYGFLFRELSNVHPEIAQIIYDRVGVREQIEILEELALMVEREDLRTELADALSETSEISVARNKIVHARWGTVDGVMARFWNGLTVDHLIAINTPHPKAAVYRRRIFTVEEIDAFTTRCVSVTERLGRVHQALLRIRFEPDLQDGVRRRAQRGDHHPALRER